MKIQTTKPVNLSPGDQHLFEAEFSYECGEPAFISKFILLFNFYSFQSFNKHAALQKLDKKFEFKRIGYFFQKKIKFHKRQAVVLDHWSSNYFHWFTEVIPSLLLLSKKKGIDRLLLPAWMKDIPFIYESLQLIPGLNYTFVANGYNSFVFKAAMVNLNIVSGRYNPSLIKGVYDLFNEGFFNMAQKKNGVFIFRSRGQKRTIINFNEVSKVLQKYQIAIVDFSEIDWKQQVAVMRSVKLLAGVHGAGLTNMLFMEKGASVFELRRMGDSQNNCYYSLASSLMHNYFYQLCEVDDYNALTQNNNFTVETAMLDHNLASILNK